MSKSNYQQEAKESDRSLRIFDWGVVVVVILSSMVLFIALHQVSKIPYIPPVVELTPAQQYVQIDRLWVTGALGCDNQNMWNNEADVSFEADQDLYYNEGKMVAKFCPKDQTRIDQRRSNFKVTFKQGNQKWDVQWIQEYTWKNLHLKDFCPIDNGVVDYSACTKHK